MNQLAQRPHLVQQPLGGAVDQSKQTLEPVHQFIEMLHSQSPGHALFRAVHVDQHWDVIAGDVFKQQGRAALLYHPIGDLGDFQIPTHGSSYPAQLSFVFQEGNEFPQVLEFHTSTMSSGMGIGRRR